MPALDIPVIAAIPNYNHGSSLAKLIPQILEQEYDGVVVCDDKSQDNTFDVVNSFDDDVELIAGSENVGAGANRNRVMQSRTLERLGTSIIHFMDADVSLDSKRTPKLLREVMDRPNLGLVGGLVRDDNGRQVVLNYGASICGLGRFIHAYATGRVVEAIEHSRRAAPRVAELLRTKLDFLLHDWPNTFEEPTARDVDWVIEANMAVRSDIFSDIGGFDPKLRFHEVQDFAMHLERRGLTCRFEPEVEVTQHAIAVRGTLQRRLEAMRASSRLVARYTLPSSMNQI